MSDFALTIDGQSVTTEKTFPVLNPATGATIRVFEI